MTPTDDTKAEDMLLPQYLPPYQAQLRAIWHKLIWTRESMHIVNSISRYPLIKFVAPHEIGFFWQLIVNNCGDAVILNLHSLVNDPNQNNLSLRRFKNAVRRWLKSGYTEWYQKRLQDARFDAELNTIAEQIDVLRDKHIAHSDWAPEATLPSVERPSISEADMEKLYQAVHNLFRICSLTTEYIIDTTDIGLGKPQPRTIDELLDLVAKNSPFITRPERRGKWWEFDRQGMSAENLEDLNNWRTKFGLPPA